MRRGVKRATAGINELNVLHLGSVGRALEHHVLEEMREAAAALRLEAEADFIVDAYGDHGGGGVWRNNYFESIRECGRLDGYLHWRGLPVSRGMLRVFFAILRLSRRGLDSNSLRKYIFTSCV